MQAQVIVTGGHPGDPEYAVGTIARYTDLGHEVVLLYLNRGEWPPRDEGVSRVAEAKKACDILKPVPFTRASSTAWRWSRAPSPVVPQDPGSRAT